VIPVIVKQHVKTQEFEYKEEKEVEIPSDKKEDVTH